MTMAKKKNWNDLSQKEKTSVAVMGSIQIALAAAAWADLAKRPADRVNGPKPLWAAIIAINFVGPIAYFIKGRKPA